jgi:hypothetical protein
MRSFYYPIICAQVAYSISIPAAHLWARSPSDPSLAARHTWYTVYPADPTNATQVSETASFLENQYGAEDMLTNAFNGVVVGWKIDLKDSPSTAQLGNYPGLKLDAPAQNNPATKVQRSGPGDDDRVQATRVAKRLLQSSTPYVIPTPKCNNFYEDKLRYVAKKSIQGTIDDFCRSTQLKGSQQSGTMIKKIYNDNTLEKLEMVIEWPQGATFTNYEAKCLENMNQFQKCDKDNNDWVSGGEVTIDVKGVPVKYRFHPPATRAQRVDKLVKSAGCKYKYKPGALHYEVWGSGWEGADSGQALHDDLTGKTVSVRNWKFNYAMGKDGREWTATFTTVLGPTEDQVEPSIDTVVNYGSPGGGKIHVECNWA